MLFNLPTRNEPTIDDIIRKAHTKKVYKPKVKVKGGTLSDKIKAICSKVKQNLGDVEYRLITKDEDFIDYCRKAVGCEFVSLDTETDGVDTMLVNLVGVCIKSTNQDSVYVPVGHISATTEELLDEQVSKKAVHDGLQLLIDSGTKFVFHNAYFDIIILHNQVNVNIKAWFDTLIGAQLLNENEPHGLKQLYAKYCAKSNDFHKFGELFDGIPISYIPPKIAGYYGQFDTVQTEALCKFQLPYLTVGTKECKEYNLEKVAKLFWEDEMPLLEVLVDMKLTGIEFDFKQAEVLKKKYTKLREEAEAKFNKTVEPIHEGINRYNFIHKDKPIPIPVNYNSPDQMKAIFYDICGLPNDYYRKKPGATGKEVRDAVLADKKLKDKPIYKIVKALDEVKMYDKAISGFVEKLTDDAIEHGGKIYCDLKQCSTDTGRLSCIAKGSLVEVAEGRVPIEKVTSGMYVYCYDDSGNLHLRRVKRVIDNGIQKCIRLVWKSTGIHKYGELVCTPDHLLRSSSGEWKRADSFVKFEQVTHLRRTIKQGRYFFYGLNSLNCNEQVIIKKDYFSCLDPNMVIHHVDENKLNNSLDNFMLMPKKDHNSYHGKLMVERGLLDVESFRKVKATYKCGKENSHYIHKTKDELLQMLKNADYRISKVNMDFTTFKKHCNDEGIDIDKICKAHRGNYVDDDTFIRVFYECNGVPHQISKKLHIGYSKIRKFIERLDLCINHKVIAIEEYGYENVYDLEVEDFHNFIANEICVHNCTSPNLQQCPSKLGDIRTMFKAGDGCVFVNCDFSKQEPCVLASASQDPKLIEVFHSGLDIYGKIASMMYDMPYEECLEFYPDGTTNHEGKNRRSSAKKTTLAIMYSKGVKSLSEDIHCTVEKAQEIYDSVLTAYPVMASWMEQTIKNAYATGIIDNIYGRRRRLPNLLLPKFDIDVPSDEAHVIDFYKNFYTDKLNKVWKDSDVNKIKDEAREYGILITDNRKEIAESYRKIINFCIQSGAAVITKRAMRNIYNNKRLRELGVKLVLSVHDKETWNCRV